MNTVMTSHSSTSGRFLALLLTVIMLGGLAPLGSNPVPAFSSEEVLEEPVEPMNSASSCFTCQSYDLYLDEMNSENGGDGSSPHSNPPALTKRKALSEGLNSAAQK